MIIQAGRTSALRACMSIHASFRASMIWVVMFCAVMVAPFLWFHCLILSGKCQVKTSCSVRHGCNILACKCHNRPGVSWMGVPVLLGGSVVVKLGDTRKLGVLW